MGLVGASADELQRNGQADRTIVELWLNCRPDNTARAYRRDVARFNAFTGSKPLQLVTLAELQAFAGSLAAAGLKPRSARRCLNAIKSLFAFAAKLRFLQFDTARPLRLPGFRETLADRILEEADVHKLLAAAAPGRNRLIIEMLYVAGVRRSELCGLTWRDARPAKGAGQITVFGKGEKTRTIRLEASTWAAVERLRGTSAPTDPVIRSRRGGRLDESQVLRIVKAAARKAGLDAGVSPHWLRHCHASHALDNGAPINLVQATLGHSSVATTSLYLHARPNQSSGGFLRTT